jgi:hypothetical protein
MATTTPFALGIALALIRDGDEPFSLWPAVLVVPTWEWDSTQPALCGVPISDARTEWCNDPNAGDPQTWLRCQFTCANGVELCIDGSGEGFPPLRRVAVDRFAIAPPLTCAVTRGVARASYVVADAERWLAMVHAAVRLPEGTDEETFAAFTAAHPPASLEWNHWRD